jgi:hypothetical protein
MSEKQSEWAFRQVRLIKQNAAFWTMPASNA